MRSVEHTNANPDSCVEGTTDANVGEGALSTISLGRTGEIGKMRAARAKTAESTGAGKK